MSHKSDTQIDELVRSMCLEEKVAQLGSVPIDQLLTDGEFSRERADAIIADGVGRVTRVGRESHLDPADLARAIADVQSYLQSETSHGIPATIREESLCGYAGRRGTTFPQRIGLASSWDPDLVERVDRAIARELQAVGCQLTLSPVADLGRDPRWGRIEETYGEDPHLTARLVCASVSGLQGDDQDGVLATLKHLVGHGRPEGGRNRAAVSASLRSLRDIDLVPFRAAIQTAGAASVMAAYHALDGVPCHASEALLTDLLRDEWGFDGTVVSDGRGIELLCDAHQTAPDRQTAGVQALTAGIDVEIPETECYGDRLVVAVRDGRVDESLVDRAVRRHLREKASVGLLDGETVDPSEAATAFGTTRSRTLAREAARRSQVLLQNEGGLLPLADDIDSVAVVGPNADAPANQLGNYAYAAAEQRGAGIEVVTPRAGIESRLESDQVGYARGCGVRPGPDDDLEAAAACAREASVAVVCVGGQSGIAVERDSPGTAGEAMDRSSLRLPGRQRALVEAVRGTGTPTVVVLVNGRPLAIPDIKDSVPAVLEAWLPGQEGGHAIADVLFGDADPGGRLPVSIPRTVGQLPITYDRTPISASGDYVFRDGDPLYPFGHGESYALFTYESSTVAAREVPTDGSVALSVAVANVGDRPGDEVIQVYASDHLASVVRPVQRLVAFRRLHLDPGERATVRFVIAAEQFAFHDAAGVPTVEPGTVDLRVGQSSTDGRLREQVELVGGTRHPTAPTQFPDVTVERTLVTDS